MLPRGIHWLSAALFFSLSSAQETSTEFATANPTSSPAAANTFVVTVGRANHQFSPDVVLANPGDIIEFQFFPPNHSVVRADYGDPCIPYEMTGPRVGFFSGFHPVDAILSSPPTWQLLINDTDPVFYYCSALGSCTDWGMVGVINPNATTSIDTQRQLALDASFQLNPGESWPAEGTASSAPETPTATLPPTTASAAPTETTSTEAAASGSGSSLSTGAIAGIAIAGAAVLIIAGVLIWYCGRQSRNNQTQLQPPTTDTHPPPGYVPPPYGGYTPISPSQKHVSGITVSSSQPSPGFHQYPYQDPHMSPFGAGQASSPMMGQQFFTPQQSTQMSPRSGAFGATPQQQQPQQQPMGETPFAPMAMGTGMGIAPAVEADSERGNSPSPRPQNSSGIEAFLARQGRMSPSQAHNHSHSHSQAGTGSESGDGPLVRGPFGGPGSPRVGPYEMSAGNTNSWRNH